MTLAPTIFESFNARFLTPEEVAATFCPPEDFWKLCRGCHSAVLGPRGSGKTSLLQMLQGRALRSWEHEQAPEALALVDFIGVFIPTDVVWHMQLSGLGEDHLGQKLRRALVQTAIAVHVLRAFLQAIGDETHPKAVAGGSQLGKLNFQQERELCEELGAAWRLGGRYATLYELRKVISTKLADIGFFVAEERLRSPRGRNERLVERGLAYPDFLELLRPALEVINTIVRKPHLKWALCFDELELAPERLQRQLFRLLRSTERTLLFKLSMSPFTRTDVDLGASQRRPNEDDDFNIIPLWYAEKRDAARFSKEIVKGMLRRSGHKITNPEKFFGAPDHTEGDEKSYAEGGSNHKQMAQLRKNDPSYRRYLEEHSIDLSKLQRMDENERARFVRKPLPSVIHRNYFRRFKITEGHSQHARSRKTFLLYTGWPAVAAACEGNPRILKGVATEVLARTNSTSKAAAKTQWQALQQAAHKFQSKLRTIRITSSGRDRGVSALLELVGEYFRSDLLGEDFKAEPVGSFELDKISAAIYKDAVGKAINAGALFCISVDRTKMILNDPTGERFRLSYLLATSFKIPLRIGVSVQLQTILQAGSAQNSRQEPLLWPDDD